MIAQWDSSLSVLPVARVQFPATAEYFKGFFPNWSHSANPSLASVAENGQSPLNDTAQPVDSEEEGRSSTTDIRWHPTSVTPMYYILLHVYGENSLVL